MTCNDFDSLLCDYLDGKLAGERKLVMDNHLAHCSGCSELTRDSREAMALMERSADVEVPPELITKILQQIPESGWLARFSQGLFRPVLQPLFQPRVVMGAMLTVLSLSMMTRCAGVPKHPLTAGDLDPVRMVGALDDKVHRGWERSVKTYESMKLVYEVQSRVNDWKEKQREEDEESKKLPKVQPVADQRNPDEGKVK
jgi:hypothetical protein